MQVTAKNIPDKQAGLERQIQNKEKTAVSESNTQAVKTNENFFDANGVERNKTSQYLKVLTRIENLLIREKLPDAAVEGFVGAVKKQLEAITESDREMLLKLPEAVKLSLNNVHDIPGLIKNDIRDQSKMTPLLKLLRHPKFADLMRTDSKPAPQIYTANSVKPSDSKESSPVNILDIPKINEKPILASKLTTGENLANIKSSEVTKLTV